MLVAEYFLSLFTERVCNSNIVINLPMCNKLNWHFDLSNPCPKTKSPNFLEKGLILWLD